jgi:carboxylate-amine ligase
MPVEFKGSEGHTIGIEEELHIVDAATGELVSKIEEIMSRLPEDLKEAVSYELFQSVLEVKTPPCANVGEAEGILRELRSRVGSWAAACGSALASAGTHPFSLYKDQKITAQDRYKRVIETLRWIAEREVIFGQHVHVGVPNEEAAIEAHNRLAEKVPLLLALSSNSPYWQGKDTGYESTRVKIFETFPRSGLPPAFPDYESFERYVDLMVDADAIDDYTFCWWDVRPHSRIGTIELRVLDSQTSLSSTVALAALTQCLVVKALSENARGPYHFDLTIENKWRAARHGLDANFYDAENRTSTPARELARALVEDLRPVSQDLGCENELLDVLEIVENGTGGQRQRRVYENSGDFLDVVAFLIEGTRPAMFETPGEVSKDQV